MNTEKHTKPTEDIDPVEAEQARWQDAIYKDLCQRVPDHLIDGGGSDSGDPLDFTLTEIGQALSYYENKAFDTRELRKQRAAAIVKDILVNHLPRIQEGLEKGYVDENQILVIYDHAVRARILTEHAE